MSNSSLERLEKGIEKSTGKKVGELRKKTIDELRSELKKEGKELKFKSYKPYIGRGSVIERFPDANEVDEMLNECLK